jgi:hypothetical protein
MGDRPKITTSGGRVARRVAIGVSLTVDSSYGRLVGIGLLITAPESIAANQMPLSYWKNLNHCRRGATSRSGKAGDRDNTGLMAALTGKLTGD